MSDGCVGFAASIHGRASSGVLSSATVITVKPRPFSSSYSACQTGRSRRHPHHEAQATSRIFLPRCSPQRVQAPVEVGQREVGRLLRGQRLAALAGGGPQERRAFFRVERQRPVERAGERGEIDPAVADQRAFIGEGDAHRVVAQQAVVNLPAQPVLQRGRIQEHALAGHARAEGDGALGVDDRERCPSHGSRRGTRLGRDRRGRGSGRAGWWGS